MIYLENSNTNPAINHAIEEYFLHETNLEVFSLWQNETCLLLGKNQDARAELNLSFIREKKIPVVRRLSGGGTVFCDLNNMQYTMITSKDKGNDKDSFKKFASPVVEFLKSLGIPATFTGRNDIMIEDKKVSGNAQYHSGKRMIHHGTLLFNVNRELLEGSINTRPIKFETKKVKSVISRVGTVSEYLGEISVSEFMQKLKNYVIEYYSITDVRTVDENTIKKAERYVARFRDPIWNFGADYKNWAVYSEKYDFGLIDYKLKIENDFIKSISFLGDYFEAGNVRELEEKLVGSKLEERAIMEKLQGMDSGDYIQGLSNEILTDGIIKAGKSII